MLQYKVDFCYQKECHTILVDLLTACREIAFLLQKGFLIEDKLLGDEGNVNVQGEDQKKLDVIADNLIISSLKKNPLVRGVASEEQKLPIIFDTNSKGEYVVFCDPLDGSSNIDVGVSVGTIFSIFKVNPDSPNFLQKGRDQVFSGYVLYGTSTVLVCTEKGKEGVQQFVLNPKTLCFEQTHTEIILPSFGTIYSVNEANVKQMDKVVQNYIANFQTDKQNYSARYIGSLVADFHRNLIKGGVYMYPATKKAIHGKLRLMYEANPLSFIIEKAEGKAHEFSSLLY